MKEKLLWISIVLLGVMLIASNAQSPSSQVGRYQLLGAKHDVSGKEQVFEQNDLFRIDTVTGVTSYYYAAVDKDGKVHSEWNAIR
jgi:C4-dicarboxylate-specific signal transduction histidine kinase